MQNFPSIAPSKPAQTTIRFRYLDGLRGLAALYVVLFHAYQEADPELDGNEFSIAIQFATRWLTHGRFSVAVFIVLSGFCLMLPVVRSAEGQLRGGFWNYLKRRSQRILPPYYAALILSLLLFIVIPESLYPRMGMHWEFAYPVFTVGNLLSHAALVHNLHPDWIFKINGPMWSVATEWQIYFLFALVLLPLWRSLGLALTVAVAVGVGFLPYFLLPKFLLEACFWYLGLFAFGMAAAVAISAQSAVGLKHVPWGKLGIGLLGIAIAIRVWNGLPLWEGRIVEDYAVGMGIACLLVDWTHQLTGGQSKPSALLQLLQSRWAVALGMFSYSLYLVHMPVLGVAQLVLSFLHLSPSKTLLALLTIATPLSMLCAYGFYRLFERQDGLQRSLERVFAGSR